MLAGFHAGHQDQQRYRQVVSVFSVNASEMIANRKQKGGNLYRRWHSVWPSSNRYWDHWCCHLRWQCCCCCCCWVALLLAAIHYTSRSFDNRNKYESLLIIIGIIITRETFVVVVVWIVDQPAVALIEPAQTAHSVPLAVHCRTDTIARLVGCRQIIINEIITIRPRQCKTIEQYLTKTLVQTLGQRAVGDFRLEIGRQARVAVALEGSEYVAAPAVGKQGRSVSVGSISQRIHFVDGWRTDTQFFLPITNNAKNYATNCASQLTGRHAHGFEILIARAGQSGSDLVSIGRRRWIFARQDADSRVGIEGERATKEPKRALAVKIGDFDATFFGWFHWNLRFSW